MTAAPASNVDPGSDNPAALPKSAKRVVVLGALSAIAMAVARLYAGERAAILLVARGPERLEQAAADLRARGAAWVGVVQMDLEAQASRAAEHIAAWKARMGGLDHVHLVYGYLGDAARARTDMVELSRILSINFTSAAMWCSATAEALRAQKRGALVAIASVAADRGRQSNYAYGAAKGALAIFVQGLAHSLAPTGARAVAMKLGFVDTPMTDGMPKGGPLWAKPDQVATAIRRAADTGGPIQYAPGIWQFIMLAIRATPSFVFHRTKL